MKDTLQKYFQKKSIYTPKDCDEVRDRLQKLSGVCSAPQVAVVIPVKNEYPGIKETLSSLSEAAMRASLSVSAGRVSLSASAGRESTGHGLRFTPSHKMLHVVCVVNCHETDSAEIKQNNAEMLTFLNECAEACQQEASHKGTCLQNKGAETLPPCDISAGLVFSAIDFSSEGHYLPEKDGVGYARKAGMDYALACGADIIACMDADTLVAENYAEELVNFSHNHGKRKYALIPFRHQKAASEKLQKAINAYENYMMIHAQKLRKTGTPYWAPVLGPSIVCTAEGYVACGGMNRRLSGEDFYFLQSLIKLEIMENRVSKAGIRVQADGTRARADETLTQENGTCAHAAENRALIDETRAHSLCYTPHFLNTEVYPSARVSDRVLFGTGPKMKELIGMNSIECPVFPDSCYEAIREFIEKKESCRNELAGFINQENFLSVWEQICANNPYDSIKKEASFHVWFDGLRIIRAIHYLESILQNTHHK